MCVSKESGDVVTELTVAEESSELLELRGASCVLEPRWEVGTPSCDVGVLLTTMQGVRQVVASVGVLKEFSQLLVLWSEVHDFSRTSRSHLNTFRCSIGQSTMAFSRALQAHLWVLARISRCEASPPQRDANVQEVLTPEGQPMRTSGQRLATSLSQPLYNRLESGPLCIDLFTPSGCRCVPISRRTGELSYRSWVRPLCLSLWKPHYLHLGPHEDPDQYDVWYYGKV